MPREHDYWVYIITNHTETVLYIGVTSDLTQRVWNHAHGIGCKFSRMYHLDRLIYHEHFGEVLDAIAREKQLKGWTRAKKEALIRTINPTYADLAAGWYPVACRRPEGPSAPLHSAQDDRVI